MTVAEGKHRRLQLAAGYGSEEKARGRINWRHVNFGGGARTGEVEAKASSLEQGLRGSFIEPYLFQRGLSLRLSGSTWWADEPVYEYRSSGGRIVVDQGFQPRGRRRRTRRPQHRQRDAHSGVRGLHRSRQLSSPIRRFATSSSRWASIPRPAAAPAPSTALELDFERNTAAQPLDPRQGYVVQRTRRESRTVCSAARSITPSSPAKCAGMCRLDRDSSGPTARGRARSPGRAPRSFRSTSAISSAARPASADGDAIR